MKDQNIQFIKTSLEALSNSLPFLYSLLKTPTYRDTVFSELMIKFDQPSQNEEESSLLYNALYEFVKVTSPYLQSYKGKLF